MILQAKKYILSTIFFFLLLGNLTAQELAPIEKYSPEIYAGGNQNWGISQNSKQFIYAANNEGLLEFNGAEWKLYPSPNKTILRSVTIIDDKIYTGCYMEFGYWEHQQNGILKYTSLSDQLKDKIQNDEQFWKIINFEDWIIFQSLNNVYFYNTLLKKFNIIHFDDILTKVFKTNKGVYLHVVNQGIFKIQEGKPQLLVKADLFNNDWITNMFDNENDLLIITQKNGFYKYSNQVFSKWKNESDALLTSTSVYSSIKLSDRSIVLGTISQGIIQIQQNGKVINRFNQINGLSNNTVLSLFEDSDNNIWAGLDNGINCINIKSPIKIYDDDKGNFGNIYTSIVFNNLLYIGTNQGLYYKKNNQNDEFKFISGTKGQVWDLHSINNTLFCGHDSGTFLIEDAKATQIATIPGTWTFRKIPNRDDLIMQGHYTGLSILHKKNNRWQLRNKIKGFDVSSRFLEIDTENNVWINHEYKGVYNLTTDQDFQKVNSINIETSVPSGKNSSIAYYKNKLIYAYKEGIYYFDSATKKFQKDTLLSKVLEDQIYTSGKLIVDENEKLWLFTKNNIFYISDGQFSKTPLIQKIPIPLSLRKAMIGYENIATISDHKYLLGKVNGFITLDLTKIIEKKNKIYITSIQLKHFDTLSKNLNLLEKGNFKYSENSLEIKFSVPEYEKHLAVDYQYMLEGFHHNWIHLENTNYVNLDNLRFGEYTFKVRAMVGNDLTINEVNYPFKINKPWFLSNFAWVVYFILVSLITALIHKSYKKHYASKHIAEMEKKKKEIELNFLENKQQIMLVKNEQLKLDIEGKNRELAISTMSIIKKNEVLNNIKKEFLNTTNTDGSNKSVLRLIDKNLNDSNDWNFFEEAFNNADKNFMKKVKKIHPTLTPNDLRLCAYLRLNLSSKEIANLLNISVRSVEIKRYRLRKKMELEHDTSLVNYILEI